MALTTVKKEIALNVGQPNNFELFCAMQGDNKSFEVTATLYDTNKLYTIKYCYLYIDRGYAYV